MTRILHGLTLFLLSAASASAAEPEVRRPVGTAQPDGVVHTVRAIPEACAWLQGRFTGDAKSPYAFAPVRSSATCQARARLVDPAKARASEASGWKLNDVIRVPSANCAGLTAVVEVWRKPGAATPPSLDAQGRARLYLQDAKAGKAGSGPVTQYTAKLALEGRACG